MVSILVPSTPRSSRKRRSLKSDAGSESLSRNKRSTVPPSAGQARPHPRNRRRSHRAHPSKTRAVLFVKVDATIDALYAEEKGTELTFTQETWDYIHKELESKHKGKKIVGWYHTHPGFGIFLSDRDLFIHPPELLQPALSNRARVRPEKPRARCVRVA